MPVIASMTMVAVVAIQSFQESSGRLTGVPPLPENPFETLVVLSYSSLTEEIGFRVFPIGIFLFAYLLLFGRKHVSLFAWSQRLRLLAMSFLFPDRAKKLVGVKTVSDFGVIGGISVAEWVMVTSTGVVFGLAHYVYAGRWRLGRSVLLLLVRCLHLPTCFTAFRLQYFYIGSLTTISPPLSLLRSYGQVYFPPIVWSGL